MGWWDIRQVPVDKNQVVICGRTGSVVVKAHGDPHTGALVRVDICDEKQGATLTYRVNGTFDRPEVYYCGGFKADDARSGIWWNDYCADGEFDHVVRGKNGVNCIRAGGEWIDVVGNPDWKTRGYSAPDGVVYVFDPGQCMWVARKEAGAGR